MKKKDSAVEHTYTRLRIIKRKFFSFLLLSYNHIIVLFIIVLVLRNISVAVYMPNIFKSYNSPFYSRILSFCCCCCFVFFEAHKSAQIQYGVQFVLHKPHHTYTILLTSYSPRPSVFSFDSAGVKGKRNDKWMCYMAVFQLPKPNAKRCLFHHNCNFIYCLHVI